MRRPLPLPPLNLRDWWNQSQSGNAVAVHPSGETCYVAWNGNLFACRTADGTPLPLPDSVEVEARRLRVGEGWCSTVGVVGYPREVRLGWLEPLVTHPGPADVSLHVEPIPAKVAAAVGGLPQPSRITTLSLKRLSRSSSGARFDGGLCK